MSVSVGCRVIAAVALTVGCVSAPHRPPGFLDPKETAQIEGHAAILRAVDRRELDPAFRSTVTDPSPAVRAHAARALGSLGLAEGRAELETLLEDPEPSVRRDAVFSLALLEGAGAGPRLEDLTGDPDPGVRAAVAWSMGRFGSPEGVEVLIRDSDPRVVAAACLAASRFPESTDLTDALLELSGSEDEISAVAATHALARLASGSDGSGGILRVPDGHRERIRERLVARIDHPDPEVRMEVAAGLTAPLGEAEVAALGTLATDPDLRVRVNAVRSLAYPGAPVEPYLRGASRDPDLQVAAALVDGLGVVGTSRATGILLDFIGPNRPAWIRTRAIASLGRVDPDRLLSLTPRFLLDDDPRIGAAALRALKGRRDSKTLDFFRRGIADAASALRVAAVEGLAAAGSPLDEIRPAVGSPEPAVRAAVARAVGSRLAGGGDGDTGFEMLARLWELSVADGIPAARLAVLEAAAVGEARPPAREILTAGVADPDRRVRKRAAELLRSRFDLDLSDRVGPPSDRTLDDYRAIATWSLTQRAAVVTVKRTGFPAGRFTLALDAKTAPLTAWNFARLAGDGFYDGLTVFDLAPNLYLRTGDPRGDGLGGPGYSLPAEPGLVPFDGGTVAMDPEDGGSSGSRWRVVHSLRPELVGRITAFGRVVQNFPGVALRVVPGDIVVSVEIYEGNGTEPLPPLE